MPPASPEWEASLSADAELGDQCLPVGLQEPLCSGQERGWNRGRAKAAVAKQGRGGGVGGTCVFKICAVILETDTQGRLSVCFWLTEHVCTALSPTGTSSGVLRCWISQIRYSRWKNTVSRRQDTGICMWRGKLSTLDEIMSSFTLHCCAQCPSISATCPGCSRTPRQWIQSLMSQHLTNKRQKTSTLL